LEKLAATYVPIDVRQLRVSVGERGAARLDLVDGSGGQIALEDLALDGLVWRVSELDFRAYAAILELLSGRYPVVNDWHCTRICSDKWRTSATLAAAGVPVVPTVLVPPGMAAPGFLDRKTVIKPCVGAGGHGVRVVQAGTDPGIAEPHVAQPLVAGPAREHVRVIVCGFEPAAAMHRLPSEQNLTDEVQINNLATGGFPIWTALEPVRDIAASVARCLGGEILGVDLVPWDGEFAVLEVNSSPGLSGIASVADVDCYRLAAEGTLARFRNQRAAVGAG
jgi:glutathione synthase/RimK-type ligase-like ATP-grasp enzyme